MYGYIYQTTNTVTGMKYIGKHKSEAFDSNYYGSGILLAEDMKRYDQSVYSVEILCTCDSLEELNQKEIYFIHLYDAVSDDMYFNLSSGGDGGDTVSCMTPERYAARSRKIHDSLLGHSVSDHTRQILREKQHNAWLNDEYRLKRKLIDEEKWKDPVVVENHLNGIHTYWENHKEERHDDMVNNAKERWENESYRQKQHEARESVAYKEIMKQKLTGKLKGYKTMHKGEDQTRVPPDKADLYLAEGWLMGPKPFSDEHRANISRVKTTKSNIIYCSELDKTFYSMLEASRTLGISEYRIKKALNENTCVEGYTLIRKERD